jgi:hypothetical protein
MEEEHCNRGGARVSFDIGKNRRTWPAKEWAITVRGEHAIADLSRSRKLQQIEDLMKHDVVEQAKLTRCEVIAVVLYTGPMVRPSELDKTPR